MAHGEPTGNPVFDFRARFRSAAQSVQRALILGGLLLFLAGGGAFLFGDITERLRFSAGLLSLAGFLLCLLGIVWGFWWRNRIRTQFRKPYGPQQ